MSLGGATARSIDLIDGCSGRRQSDDPTERAAADRPVEGALVTPAALDATVLIGDLQPRRAPGRHTPVDWSLLVSKGRRWGSHRRRQQFERQHSRRGRAPGAKFRRLRCCRDARARQCGYRGRRGRGHRHSPMTTSSSLPAAVCDERTGRSMLSVGYAGGPIRPIPEVAPPAWLELDPW